MPIVNIEPLKRMDLNHHHHAPGRIIMRKAMLFLTLIASGVALSIVFGLILLMRRVSIYQMNHMKAL
jgi:hypothetical protein